MPVTKVKSWKEVFMEPTDVLHELENGCPDDMYFRKHCYPVILDSAPVEERHKDGYFFDDEITRDNADMVRVVKTRSFDPVMPPDWDMAEDLRDKSLDELFDMRCAGVELRPFMFPDFSLNNLEMVVGDLLIPNRYPYCIAQDCNVQLVFGDVLVKGKANFHKLNKVDGRVVISSFADGRFADLEFCGMILIDRDGYGSFPNLKSQGIIEINGGSGNFPALSDVNRLFFLGKEDTRDSGVRCDSLLTACVLDIHIASSPTDIYFPKLRSVSSYLGCHGNLHVDFPSLLKTGALVVSGSGSFDARNLDQVGAYCHDSHTHWGDCELTPGKAGLKIEMPKLSVIHGDLEYCIGVRTKLSSLNTVFGNLFLDGGDDNFFPIRGDVSDGSVNIIELDNLKHVGKNLSVYDNARLLCPNLNKVDGRLDMYANSSIKSNGRFEVGSVGFIASVDVSFKVKKNLNHSL